MVISAPAGSGKTVLFELCILRLLSRFISTEGVYVHAKGSLKADIVDADIILTTSEKFDDVTRYHIKVGGLSFFSDIALVQKY
ncbi:unnamed protein product [Cuscuta campestris]|uniref:Uncharacterized protein n=1 Tax=Cuscuta campestris TaxID=132261 RepID=A0A484MR58_9ASTE|nr:unnamed protein product [Cuscuta campestris]